MEVRYHPLLERWLTELAEADEEIFGEVVALLNALEAYGRDLDDERRKESHPVVTSRYDLHALRRTPPTDSTPYATSPPVLRILSTPSARPPLGPRSLSLYSAATRPLSATPGTRPTSPSPSIALTITAVKTPPPPRS